MLERAVEQATASGIKVTLSLQLAFLGEANLLADRIRDASEVTERALELSRNHKERGHEAWVLRLLGEIASHGDQSEVKKAEEHYQQACALAEELAMRPLLAHCHLGLGKLYRRTGKPERASEHLTTAITMYREMDMRFWLEKAEAALKELG